LRTGIRVGEGLRTALKARVFASHKEETAGGWRKLHNETRRDLCSSDIIKSSKDDDTEGTWITRQGG
jgi:hypothetical protein